MLKNFRLNEVYKCRRSYLYNKKVLLLLTLLICQAVSTFIDKVHSSFFISLHRNVLLLIRQKSCEREDISLFAESGKNHSLVQERSQSYNEKTFILKEENSNKFM